MSTLLIVAGVVGAVAAAAAIAWYVWKVRKSRPRTFEGTFTFGWEVSAFIPGSESKKAPRYWLAWVPDSGFMEAFKAQGFDPAWTPGYGSARTRFVGTLEAESDGGYGHMGQYSGQVTVLRVLEMRPVSREN